MALAPLLYNITFDSQTRILYFWDKAGHEIYHCEIPSPAPALPTVTRKSAQPFPYNSYINLSAGSESDLYVYESGSYRALGYDSNNLYSIYGCYSDTYYGGQGWIRGVLFDTVISQNTLKAKNITSSTIPYIDYFSVAICSSPDATIITVYDSSNNPYNAFQYTSDGTDYYYVLDGTQTDWTDDLESIGYHVLSVAYLDIQDKYVNWNVWVWLYENSSASQTVSFDSNKRYIFDSAYTVNGSKVNLASHTITIGRPNSTYEILGLIDSYSGFAAYKVYYHAIPNSQHRATHTIRHSTDMGNSDHCGFSLYPSDTNDSSGYNTALALVIITQSVMIRASEWSGSFFLCEVWYEM